MTILQLIYTSSQAMADALDQDTALEVETQDSHVSLDESIPTVLHRCTAKLRPAADVLNRIRWDDGYDAGDYIIGYEDRFDGTCEMLFSLWQAESTEEDFIPQHRIVYFKRRSDGLTVWDRKSKTDLVFRSGRQSEEPLVIEPVKEGSAKDESGIREGAQEAGIQEAGTQETGTEEAGVYETRAI